MICPNVNCENKKATLIGTEDSTIIIKRIYLCEKCGSDWMTFERVDIASYITATQKNLNKEVKK